ncbi:MAG: multidrug ABC transporter permease [Flammeovirgaceae bacterium]|nr:multidrug ABC transporter permease [Flammeovirgaceae bacterium]MBE61304.1 multidrug ABC transporter permease [Flammeovirgaceae bacterium]HCX23238.1 multidrug ABC transporter permease [Cytophagales bacterium]|tara:strand:- start:2330 stop:3436 length:1107 start_codon:yes stop_codon:yes gene_type:complete
MKRFLAFVKKEFFHIFRDKRTLLILFGMPVAQIMLFGYAITNEIRDAKIGFLDLSKDEKTLALKEKILSNSYFEEGAKIYDQQEMETAFKNGSVKIIVLFEQNFANNLESEGKAAVQLIADASDPNTANTLVNYLQAIVGDFTLEQNGSSSIPFSVNVQSRYWYNPELDGVYYFVPGLIAILLMLVSAMMTSISIAREKELGTMEVLLASPMQPAQIVLAKVIPYVLLSLIDALIILGLGKFVFGVPILGNFGLLLFETFLFILLALSLGILISTVTETQQTALLLSLMGLMLPTILLSGFIFPIENMPLPLRIISHIVPARWFIVVVKAIMLKGSGLALIWKETVILCGFILFFIAVSVKKFKVRLE